MPKVKVLQSGDLASWWVYVIHTDGKKEFAKISQFKDWKPTHPRDFNSKDKHVLRTNAWRNDGKFDLCKVHVLNMGGDLEDLKKTVEEKRVTYPPLDQRASDYLSEGTDLDMVPEGLTRKAGSKRPHPAPAERTAKKAKADLKDMEKFANKVQNLFTGGTAAKVTATASTSRGISEPKLSKLPALPISPAPVPQVPAGVTPVSLAMTSNPKSTQKTPLIQKATPQLSSPLATPLSLRKSVSKNVTHPICRSTQPSVQALPSGNNNDHSSKVARNVEKSYPPSTSSAPSDAGKVYSTADMKMKDDELERLKQQLVAAQDQLAKKDNEILGEIRSLSLRVAHIEEAITSKCNPDFRTSVQLWLDNHYRKSHCETNSSHSA